jgi:hypothetical protein
MIGEVGLTGYRLFPRILRVAYSIRCIKTQRADKSWGTEITLLPLN